MAQPARAPASAKSAPSRGRPGTAVAQPKRTAAPTAPAVQRVAPHAAPCACGGHCPKCARNSHTHAPGHKPAPVSVTLQEDTAAENEAEKIARILLGAFSNSAPLVPPDHGTCNAFSPTRIGPLAPLASLFGRRLPPTSVPHSSLGLGQALPSSLLQRLEPLLGVDLSALRLHTGPTAEALALQHHARAFTYGSHLVFGAGEYAPGSARGLHVLVHEIVHAIQQSPSDLAARTRPPPHPRHTARVTGLATPSASQAPQSIPGAHASVPAHHLSAHHPWASGALAPSARPRGPPSAQAPPVSIHPISISHHFTQPRVQCISLPSWDEVSDTVVNVGSDALDTASDVGSAALGVAVDVGEGALELGAAAVERTAEFFLSIVDEYAPGLMEFLRGGFMGRLTDLFCRGLDAVIGRLISSLEDIDFVSALEEAFASAQGSVEGVIGAIRSGASSALGALMQPVVEALDQYGPGIIEAITGASDSVNGFFDSIWESIGAPALAFLEDAGGEIYKEITDTIDWLWDSMSGVRDFASDAWDWVMEQFDIAWDSTSSIRDWLSEKATEAWDSLTEALGPLRGPITTLVGVLLILSPLGPIIIATQVIPPLWEKLTWLWNNWNTNDILVWAQDTLRDDILPGVIGLVSGVAAAIANAASWIAGVTVQVATAFAGVLGVFGGNTCLASVTRVLTAISAQFDRLAAWAEGGFTGLADAVANVFHSLVAILQPILDFLIRLFLVVTNPPLLPIALASVIWLLIPDELKPPVINFVLDLIIAFLRGFPAFLTGLGPIASIMKAGVLGFLEGLRSKEDQLKIDASNKIANLMAGGGIQFISGFAVGLLEGLIDGILDPFRLIWMLVQFLARVCRSIGDYLAPLLFEGLPPVGAAVADSNATVRASIPAHPPAHAPPAPSHATTAPPVATGGTAPLPSTEAPAATGGATAAVGAETHTLTRGAPGSGAGPTSSAPPSGGAAPSGAAVASPEDLAMAEIMGAGPTASDAEIVASLSPGISGDLIGSAGELDAVGAEGESAAVSETRSEGSSVRSLSSLLGGVWTAIIDGAHGIGGSAATALLEFIMLPDYQLGNKIGYVAGLILLEVIIAYFSGGVSVELKAAEPFIKAAIRFLDLGGEILGLLGRAVRPIKGPLLRGLSAAGETLGRFRFLQPILQRIRRAADVLFHFGDEAADAASHAGSRVDDAGRAATHADDVARQADDIAGAERHADEAGDTARKAAELPVAIAAAEAICEANDRIEPSPPPIAVHAQLNATLRPRFPWIDGFFSVLKAPGVYEIHLQASDHVIKRRYTAGETADETGVTRHEPGPEPIVEHRRGGSGARPDASASPTPTRGPDTPEPIERFPDLDEHAPGMGTSETSPLRDPGPGGGARGAADESLSVIDRPKGAPPIESGIKGDIGEVTHADEVVGGTPARSTDHFPNATLTEMREQLLRGDITLREFAEMFPDEGAAQVFLPTGRGGRYIDHMFVDGGSVVLRESKNVATFRLIDDYALQLQKDLDLLRAFPDARVEWRISGNIDAEAMSHMQQLAAANPGRFSFVLDAPGPHTFADGRFIVPSSTPTVVRVPPRVARLASGSMPPSVPRSVHTAIGQPGQELNGELRWEMESFFGADLEKVRVHTDSAAAQAASDSRAHALAFEHHVLLGAQHRDFSTPATQRTLAHEIAHTLQPAAAPGARPFAPDNSPAESAAHSAASSFDRTSLSASLPPGVLSALSARRSAMLHREPGGPAGLEQDPSTAEMTETGGRGAPPPSAADITGPLAAIRLVGQIFSIPVFGSQIREAAADSLSQGVAKLIELNPELLAVVGDVLHDPEKYLAEVKSTVQPHIESIPALARKEAEERLGALQVLGAPFARVIDTILLQLEGLGANWWPVLKDVVFQQIALWDWSSQSADLAELDRKYFVEQSIGTFDYGIQVVKVALGGLDRILGAIGIGLWLASFAGGTGIGTAGGGAVGSLAAGAGAAPGAVAGGGTGATAGGGVGAAAFEIVGLISIGTSVAADVAILGKSIIDLNAHEENAEDTEEDYQLIASSIISLTLTGGLFVLGAVASSLAKKLSRKLLEQAPRSRRALPPSPKATAATPKATPNPESNVRIRTESPSNLVAVPRPDLGPGVELMLPNEQLVPVSKQLVPVSAQRPAVSTSGSTPLHPAETPAQLTDRNIPSAQTTPGSTRPPLDSPEPATPTTGAVAETPSLRPQTEPQGAPPSSPEGASVTFKEPSESDRAVEELLNGRAARDLLEHPAGTALVLHQVHQEPLASAPVPTNVPEGTGGASPATPTLEPSVPQRTADIPDWQEDSLQEILDTLEERELLDVDRETAATRLRAQLVGVTDDQATDIFNDWERSIAVAEDIAERTGIAPGAGRSHFEGAADDVRDQAHPRISESTSAPERARAAEELASQNPRPSRDLVDDEVSFGAQEEDFPAASLFGEEVDAIQGALRLAYMGNTPSMYSAVGAAVVLRMRTEGTLRGTGLLEPGNPNKLEVLASDGNWYLIDEFFDMAHFPMDAVRYWNEEGRFHGARSREVRDFMTDPDNYILEPRSLNRSAGARLGETYLPPEDS